MVHLLQRKGHKSEIAAMLENEIKAKKVSSGSQGASNVVVVRAEPAAPKSDSTDPAGNITGESDTFPDIAVGGKIVRETPVNKNRRRSGSPSNIHDLQSPLSPPEFPLRQSIGHSPTEVPSSKKLSKLSFRHHRNPFADTEPSGDTPKIPQNPDPQLLQMKSVAAEQIPTVITSEGPPSAKPGKGDIVTDKGLEQARMQRRTLSGSNLPLADNKPAARKSSVKDIFRRKKPLQEHEAENTCERKADGKSPVDHLKVKIPHISFDEGFLWDESK